jgi:signal transduction histidine kinase
MEDRKALIFPSLLFAALFILITITGYFQIRVIRQSIEGLLKSEGEIFFKHIQREIDRNLEYLGLLEKSPSIITPNFLNIMAYDEAIVEDLYNQITGDAEIDVDRLPLANVLVTRKNGKTLVKKGTLTVPLPFVMRLVSGREDTLIQMPSHRNQALLVGIRVADRLVFFSLDEEELEGLRTRYIIKDILDREDKRFNIVGIRIYDQRGKPYLALDGKEDDLFVLSRPLDSRFLPGFRMEIHISRELANSIFKSSSISFVFILILLFVSGALSTYAIFLLQRKHERRMKEIENEMAIKERLVSLGKLASGMAHEIRNPLNAISISVQRLKREFQPEEEKTEEYRRFVDIIRGELLRVNRIVEEFLLSTKAQVPFLNENLCGIMDEVLIILKEKANSRGIEITNTIGRGTTLECQKERIKQVFHNIILNGIEAIDNSGKIEISADKGNKGTNIYIRDTGLGIKKEKVPAIFEYYYTTKDKGMGLGLPISYMIVKDHGGDIKVESEEGKGATFIITLPTRAPQS